MNWKPRTLSWIASALLLLLTLVACAEAGEDDEGAAPADDDGAQTEEEGTADEGEEPTATEEDTADADAEDDAGGGGAAEEFYSDNDITLRVGLGEGGGYDQAARLVSRHLGRHVPGNPQVTVENHTGAGSVLNANQIAAQVPSDGSVIAINHRNNILRQILGADGVEFDSSEFRWLGGFTETVYGVLVRAEVAETIEEAMEQTIIMGATGPGASTFDTPLLVNGLAGTQFEIVPGYDGAADVALAVERGDVEGQVYGLDGLLSTHAHWVEDDFVNVLLLVARNPDERMPDVPIIYDYVEGEEDQQIADLYTGPLAMGYPFYAPPDTPDEIVEALRQAFEDMSTDPEFLADGEEIALDPRPFHTGEELQQLAEDLLATPDEVVELYAELFPDAD